MKTDLPRTDVDSFTQYEWQVSSAIRPLWGKRVEVPYKVHLRREVYFGRLALAEPVRGQKEGPPYTVLTMPQDTLALFCTQDEVSFAFSREEAERAVRRYERAKLKEQTEPTFFDPFPNVETP